MNHQLAIATPSVGTLSETFIARHITQLASDGAAVICDTVVKSASGLPEGIPVLDRCSRPNWARRRIHASLGFKLPLPFGSDEASFLRSSGCEVLLGEYLDFSVPFLPIARRAHVRFFAHAHGHDVSAALRNQRTVDSYRSYSDADGIITMSRFSCDALVGLGLPSGRIHVIPYGVDVPERPADRKVEGEHVTCLAVGRLVGKKAPVLLLDAFRRAHAQDSRLRLKIVGDGPLRAAAQQFIHCFALGGCVELLGALPPDATKREIGAADIFLQHSVVDPVSGDSEGLPVSILEAMAHAIPVISTRHAGIPEAVIPGETGLIVEEGDTAAMAGAIVECAKEPALRSSMGRAAHARALSHFTWELERSRLRAVLGIR